MIEVKDYVSVKTSMWDELIEVEVTSTYRDDIVARIKEGLKGSSTLVEVLRVLEDNKVEVEGLRLESDKDVFRLTLNGEVEVELTSSLGIKDKLMFIVLGWLKLDVIDMLPSIEVEDYIYVKVFIHDDFLDILIRSTGEDGVVAKLCWELENSSSLKDALRVLKNNKLKLEGISKDGCMMSYSKGENAEFNSYTYIQHEIQFIIPR